MKASLLFPSLTLTICSHGSRHEYWPRRSTILNPPSTFIALLFLLIVLNFPARAGLLFYDPFDYPVATVLDDAETPWQPDASTGDYIQVVANNLTVPGLVTPSGRSIQLGDGGVSSRRVFGTQTSGTLYYSLALRLDTTNFTEFTGQDILAAFNAGYATLWLRPATNAFQVGLHFGSGTAGGHEPLFATDLCQPGQIIFVVAAYQFVGGTGNDVVSLWINPSPTTFGLASAPPPTLTETSYTTDPGSLNNLYLRQGHNYSFASVTVDEVRVGTSWADITPPAALNTPAIVWSHREHTAGVTSLAFSPDKQLLASGSADSNVHVWRIAGDERPHVLSVHTHGVRAVAFSPAADLLASAGGDGAVTLWAVGWTNPPRLLAAHDGPVNSIAFSPSGQILLSGGEDRALRVWRVADGQLMLTISNHTDRVVAVGYAPDGETLLSACQDGAVRFWEGERGRETGTPILMRPGLSALVFSTDGLRWAGLEALAAPIHLWDAEKGTVMQVLAGHAPESRCAAFSLDGYLLATAGRDQALNFWRLDNGQEILSLTNETVGVAALAFSGDERYFAYGRDDGTVALASHWMRPLVVLTEPQKLVVGKGTNALFTVDARGVGELGYQWMKDGLPLLGATSASLMLTNVQTTNSGDYLVRVSDTKEMVEVTHTLTVLSTDAIWLRDRTTGGIKCLAASRDGTTLATGHADQTIRIWRASDGYLLRRIQVYPYSMPSQLAFSPDGTMIGSVTTDGMARLWRLADGTLFGTYTIPANLANSLAFSPDSLNLLTGGGFYSAYCTSNFVPAHWIPAYPSGQHFVPGGWSTTCSTNARGAINCRRLADGLELWLTNFSWPVKYVAWSPDGATFAMSYKGLSLRRTSDRSELWFAGWYPLTSLAFSPTGTSLLASRGGLNDVILINATNGAMIRGFGQSVAPLAIANHGLWLAAVSTDLRRIKLWDAGSGALWQSLTGHTAAVTGLAALPDTNLLVSASADDSLRLWQLSDASVLWSSPPAGHSNSVEALAFSPDGTTLASGSYDSTMKLWQVADGSLLRACVEEYSVDALAFAPAGSLYATATTAGSVHVWQAVSGTSLRALASSSSAKGLAWSPDSQALAGGGNNLVKLWRASDGALTRTLTNHVGLVIAVAFSKDGKTLASGGADKNINVWNVTNGSLLQTLSGHTNTIKALVYSPDGSLLASASSDRTVKLWSAPDYTPRLTLTGHTGAVNDVAFSADSRTLVSVSEDRTVRFWSATNGVLLLATDADVSAIRSVACAPVGRLFAYGRSDGAVVLARNPFAWPVARLGAVDSPGGGPFQFTLFGDLDSAYRVQTSSDLLNWSDWLNLVCTNFAMPVPVDLSSTNLPRRFYRAVTP